MALTFWKIDEGQRYIDHVKRIREPGPDQGIGEVLTSNKNEPLFDQDTPADADVQMEMQEAPPFNLRAKPYVTALYQEFATCPP